MSGRSRMGHDPASEEESITRKRNQDSAESSPQHQQNPGPANILQMQRTVGNQAVMRAFSLKSVGKKIKSGARKAKRGIAKGGRRAVTAATFTGKSVDQMYKKQTRENLKAWYDNALDDYIALEGAYKNAKELFKQFKRQVKARGDADPLQLGENEGDDGTYDTFRDLAPVLIDLSRIQRMRLHHDTAYFTMMGVPEMQAIIVKTEILVNKIIGLIKSYWKYPEIQEAVKKFMHIESPGELRPKSTHDFMGVGAIKQAVDHRFENFDAWSGDGPDYESPAAMRGQHQQEEDDGFENHAGWYEGDPMEGFTLLDDNENQEESEEENE